MYTGHGFNDWGIGDVDIIKVDDTYHLFHLVLPNHAYIAHATSKDGLNWTRVRNALFVGDPGEWDDDMLWTMHVTPDPHQAGRWRMFYTGLCRQELGRIQRVGLAVSDDLYTWTKVDDTGWPLAATKPHYESGVDEGRHWVSFRDPYFAKVDNEGWLLVAARVPKGPVNRRGCVYLAKETAPGKFEAQPPLTAPNLYDDLEVPMIVPLAGRWYLIGSIREDIKVHYWVADQPQGPYSSFSDNVLLPTGNYAARICDEGDRFTLWSFFFEPSVTKGMGNMLPPPKELVTGEDGQLRLRSFRGFDDAVVSKHEVETISPLRILGDVESASVNRTERGFRFGCDYNATVFVVPNDVRNFRLRGTVTMDGVGKCGLALRVNENGDGYFVSLDLLKGLVQIRAWGNNPGGGIEEAFIYKPLQANYFLTNGLKAHRFELLALGDYIEFSIDDDVMLCLADDTYHHGQVGFYTESAWLQVDDLTLEELEPLEGENWGGTHV